jgi:hypothetical protein
MTAFDRPRARIPRRAGERCRGSLARSIHSGLFCTRTPTPQNIWHEDRILLILASAQDAELRSQSPARSASVVRRMPRRSPRSRSLSMLCGQAAALAVFRSRSLFGLSPLAWGPQISSMYRCSDLCQPWKRACANYELHRKPPGAPFCYIFGEAALLASDRSHSKRYGDSAGMGTCCPARDDRSSPAR